MPCIFCRSETNLTDEHIFPAFMGGRLVVKDGSCERCNGEFAVAEGELKKAMAPLLHVLRIKNRDGIVRNASVNAEIRGLDMKHLRGFINAQGDIRVFDKVVEGKTEDGRKIRRGFFMSKRGADKFVERAVGKGEQVVEREVPKEIVIQAEYIFPLRCVFSLEARKIAAKVALTALAYQYGIEYALLHQFDEIRNARIATGNRDLRVWAVANEGLISANLRTAHQHSVIAYLSAGWQKAWAVVTFFGGIMYRVDLSSNYAESASRQFSIFYDAVAKQRENPILLANEMTLIGHMLSSASKFEDRDAVDAQVYPLFAEFCAEKGLIVERVVLPDGEGKV